MGTGDRVCTIRSINAAQCIPLSPSGGSVIAKSFANGQSMYHGDLLELPLSGRCIAVQEAARQGVRTALVFPVWGDLHSLAHRASLKPMAVLQVLITAPHIPSTSLIEVASYSSTLVGLKAFLTPPTPWPLFLSMQVSDAKAVLITSSVQDPSQSREFVYAKGKIVGNDGISSSCMGPASLLKARMVNDANNTPVTVAEEDRDNGGWDTSGEDGDQKDSDAGSPEENHAEFHPGTALTMQDIQAQFGVGLRQAASNLGLSMTTLKRCCRKYGITRWPRRELAKLKKALDSVGAVGALGSRQVTSLSAKGQTPVVKVNQHEAGSTQSEDKLSRKERDAMNMLFALHNNSSDLSDAVDMEEGRKRIKL